MRKSPEVIRGALQRLALMGVFMQEESKRVIQRKYKETGTKTPQELAAYYMKTEPWLKRNNEKKRP